MSQTVASAATNLQPGASGPGVDRHPTGLIILFATEMWERFGFYTVLAVMTLFLQDKVEGFGWTKSQATGLWANYLMFVYLTPFIGGWIADRSWDIGGASCSEGSSSSRGTFSSPRARSRRSTSRSASSSPAMGSSSPTSRRWSAISIPLRVRCKDSAYNIFYMGINVGAFLAPVVRRGPPSEDRIPGGVLRRGRGNDDRDDSLQHLLSLPHSRRAEEARR